MTASNTFVSTVLVFWYVLMWYCIFYVYLHGFHQTPLRPLLSSNLLGLLKVTEIHRSVSRMLHDPPVLHKYCTCNFYMFPLLSHLDFCSNAQCGLDLFLFLAFSSSAAFLFAKSLHSTAWATFTAKSCCISCLLRFSATLNLFSLTATSNLSSISSLGQNIILV